MKKSLGVMLLASLLGAACSGLPPASTHGGQRQYVEQGEVGDANPESLPPLPTFREALSCEQAFGAGRCGTGAEVYSRALLVAPPEVSYLYMPYAYASYTGALNHVHLSPPAVYAPTVQYQRYIAPAYVASYRAVSPGVVRHYHSLTDEQRVLLIRQGPLVNIYRRGAISPFAKPAAQSVGLPVQQPPSGVPTPSGRPPPAAPVGPPVRPPASLPPPSKPLTSTPTTPPQTGPAKPKDRDK